MDTNSRLANAMAQMVKMDLRGFRQMLRQAILTSMEMMFYLLEDLRDDKVKRRSGRSSLKVSSI
jgi:hypothetical protein